MELGEALTTHQAVVSSMNARVRATSWLGGDRIRATVLMLVDRPGRLRLEAEVSLQGTVAVLATDGRQFAFLDTTKNEMRRGPACPANVASLIRIPLAPPEVAAILLGDARLPPGATFVDATVDWDADRGADVLAVRTTAGGLRFLFQRVGGQSPRNQLVGAVATGPDGRHRWRVAFEDLADVPTAVATPGQTNAPRAWLPQTIRFAEGDDSFDEGVEIKFKERTLNEPLADNAFTLDPPAGAAIINVGCPTGASMRP